LDFCKRKYCLEIKMQESDAMINATGAKINYYSKNKKAKNIGYQPRFSSMENIDSVFENILNKAITLA
ncbi:MAG TPA: hypothetical protein VFV39_05975, partial [Limnobacter sp.]|nr:hypothetical protein [Limnobacter sp.]